MFYNFNSNIFFVGKLLVKVAVAISAVVSLARAPEVDALPAPLPLPSSKRLPLLVIRRVAMIVPVRLVAVISRHALVARATVATVIKIIAINANAAVEIAIKPMRLNVLVPPVIVIKLERQIVFRAQNQRVQKLLAVLVGQVVGIVIAQESVAN